MNAEPEKVYLDRPPKLPRVYTVERHQYVEVNAKSALEAIQIARDLPERAWVYSTGSMLVIGYEDEVGGAEPPKMKL